MINEREQDKLTALRHLIIYTVTNPDVKDYEIWDCVMRMEQVAKDVNTPSALAEGFSRLRGLLLLATFNMWRGLLGIEYPGYLFREPKNTLLLESESQPARK